MKRTFLISALALAAPLFANAQAYKLAVTAIGVNNSVQQGAAANGNQAALTRVAETVESQLIDALHQQRKFEIIGRDALAMQAAREETDFASSGIVDVTAPGASERFRVLGAEYILVAEVNDFQDQSQTVPMPGSGKTMVLRTIRLGTSARIYNASTMKLLESANFQFEEKDLEEQLDAVSKSTGRSSDHLYYKVARSAAEKAALRVVDVLYPARVLSKNGPMVTISRGDGANIARGQKWDVFALGKELIDPDTGMSLGQEEVYIGQVEVVRVNPNFSQAKILEDYGIEEKSILRLSE
jgi:hypothetical protein